MNISHHADGYRLVQWLPFCPFPTSSCLQTIELEETGRVFSQGLILVLVHVSQSVPLPHRVNFSLLMSPTNIDYILAHPSCCFFMNSTPTHRFICNSMSGMKLCDSSTPTAPGVWEMLCEGTSFELIFCCRDPLLV